MTKRSREHPEDLLGVDALARRYGASPTAIRLAIEKRELEAIVYERFVRIRRREFLHWHYTRTRGGLAVGRG